MICSGCSTLDVRPNDWCMLNKMMKYESDGFFMLGYEYVMLECYEWEGS